MRVLFYYNNNIKAHLLWALMLLSLIANTQNLVPNQSFEYYTGCPDPYDFSSNSIPPWYSPTSHRTADYGNACITNPCCGVPSNLFGSSYRFAKTGNAYAVMEFITYYGQNQRDYIHTKLFDSLNKGRCYYVEFYVSLITGAQYPVNNIALHISDTSVWSVNGRAINVYPQIINYGNPIIKDTINWVKVGGYIQPMGEKCILRLVTLKMMHIRIL